MRKIRLFHNPAASRRSKSYTRQIDEAAVVFKNAGIEVSIQILRQPNDASERLREALADGCDTVFACGGDGTIHSLLQGLVGTNISLGIIPMGTANALAHDIRVPVSSIRAAAQAALTSQKHRVSVGRIEYKNAVGESESRYFMIAAGIGIDAAMLQGLNPRTKARFGMAAYYAAAWRSWLLNAMNFFWVECDGHPERYNLTQLLAVRISNFGGLLRKLAPGASLERNDFRLVMCSNRNRLSYLAYVLRGIVGASWTIPGVENRFSCEISAGRLELDGQVASTNVYVQADGELLGTLPVRISIVPNSLTLLIPN
jgi:diacylglycerol kinase (ATP)